MTVGFAIYLRLSEYLRAEPVTFEQLVEYYRGNRANKPKIAGFMQVDGADQPNPLVKAVVDEFVQGEGLQMELLPWMKASELPSAAQLDPLTAHERVKDYMLERMGQFVPIDTLANVAWGRTYRTQHHRLLGIFRSLKWWGGSSLQVRIVTNKHRFTGYILEEKPSQVARVRRSGPLPV